MTNKLSSPVLLTGASGYLGSWICKLLLDQGLSVRASVRDAGNQNKVSHLLKLAENSPGDIELFSADLLRDGAFDDAAEDCSIVFHCASPFIVDNIQDVREQLLRPALEGTQNVLNSVNKSSSVKKVVLTSSVAAIYGDNQDILKVPARVFTEQQWNMSSSEIRQPYFYSKTIAERLAWKMREEQSRWKLSTLNPSLILGPSLSSRKDSTSLEVLLSFANGEFAFGAPDIWNGIVDVRDVAQAHVNAALKPEMEGRFIVANEALSFLDISKILQSKYGKQYPFPKWNIPKPILWLASPLLGLEREWVTANVGIPIQFDNLQAASKLGVSFRPIKDTLLEHFEQIINNGWLD